jgi:hypothetical protein
MKLLEIGGRTVALGLFWQPRETKSLKVEARELALEMASGADARKFNFVSLRTAHQEYGLAECPEGRLTSKVLALAGVLADQATGKWAAHYALDTRQHWVLCVIEGQILADGDVVLEEADAARKLMAAWQSSYSGLTVESHESHEEALALLSQLVVKARGPALVPLNGSGFPAGKKARFVALAASVTALAIGVAYLWRAPAGNVEATTPPGSPTGARDPGPNTPSSMSMQARSSPVPAVSVTPSALGQACLDQYLREPMSIAGWWTTEWTCKSPGTLVVTWRRGTDGSFLNPPPGALIDPANPEKATQSRTLEVPPGESVGVVQRSAAATNLYEVARVFGLQLNVTWPSAQRLPNGVEVPGQPSSLPPFETTEFHLAAKSEGGPPDVDLFEAFGKVPGLALRSVTWREAEHEWAYEGLLYTSRSQQ